jgi:hypothetical protein
MLDVVMATPNPMLHIVGGRELLYLIKTKSFVFQIVEATCCGPVVQGYMLAFMLVNGRVLRKRKKRK